jgi:hypothetical protein
MAGSRTLKLSILADVDDLRKKLTDSSNEVEGFGSKVADFGKKAGLAFAAAGAAAAAYAGKLLVDGVKAAIEDEKAQTALATSLRNVAGASDEVVANVEKYISKTAVAVGVTDDQLRPSFDRLVRSTKDVEAAQRLQALALDIAAGSGKSLESVSSALARGFDGNTAALGRLGVGLSAAELKSMTFDEVTKQLAATFGGQATEQAETFAGKMQRLGIAFDEAKETVGSFVLDAITPLITNFVDKGIPAIQDFADKIGGQLSPVFTDLFIFIREEALPALQRWYQFLVNVVIPAIIKTVTPVIQGIFSAFNKVKTAIDQNYESLKPLIDGFKAFVKFVVSDVLPIVGKGLGTAFSGLGSIIAGLVKGFAAVANAIDNIVDGVRSLINLVTSNPVVKGIGNLISSAFGGGRAEGGSVKAGTSYVVGERGAEMFVPKTDGVIVPNNKLSGGGVVNNFNINVTGALDQEGVARQIVDILNNSFYRGTIGAGGLVSA